MAEEVRPRSIPKKITEVGGNIYNKKEDDSGANKMTMAKVEELFKGLPEIRKRIPIPDHILKRAFKEVDKLKAIPFKRKHWDGIFWGENPITENVFTLDIPHIEVSDMTYTEDIHNDAIFYDEKKIKKEGIKYVNKSCIITHKGEIVLVYITAKTDKSVKKASEKLRELGEQMNRYYPVKSKTFYTPFILTKANPTKQDLAKVKTDLESRNANVDRYSGKNWMDGMIRYHLGLKDKKGGTVIAYQPRKLEANDDEDFLFNLIYSFCALYELEKKYCPAVAEYRYKLAKDVGYVGSFPNVPLERHCATGVGGSYDFASSIHDDSGIKGLTESIIWSKCNKGSHQIFVCPPIKMCFDLSDNEAVIFQPPKIPHGTVSSGNHGGYGFVNITKRNLVIDTPITERYYQLWRKFLHQ
jgi:hypothetical protein